MEHAIEILKERLDKLNNAYSEFVLNGTVKTDSTVAIDNRKKAKDIEDALFRLADVIKSFPCFDENNECTEQCGLCKHVENGIKQGNVL
jgi:hypothetical protein